MMQALKQISTGDTLTDPDIRSALEQQYLINEGKITILGEHVSKRLCEHAK